MTKRLTQKQYTNILRHLKTILSSITVRVTSSNESCRTLYSPLRLHQYFSCHLYKLKRYSSMPQDFISRHIQNIRNRSLQAFHILVLSFVDNGGKALSKHFAWQFTDYNGISTVISYLSHTLIYFSIKDNGTANNIFTEWLSSVA